MDRRVAYRLRKPWIKYICWAKRRCTDKKSKWFRYYGAKGITCTLTVDEAEQLWRRDRAQMLRRPSLDRVDPKLGYTFANCRFIEFDTNSRMGWDPTARPDDIEDDEFELDRPEVDMAVLADTPPRIHLGEIS